MAASAYHPSCTCKMGSESDKLAVVNPKTMGIYGLEDIYVYFCLIHSHSYVFYVMSHYMR